MPAAKGSARTPLGPKIMQSTMATYVCACTHPMSSARTPLGPILEYSYEAYFTGGGGKPPPPKKIKLNLI